MVNYLVCSLLLFGGDDYSVKGPEKINLNSIGVFSIDGELSKARYLFHVYPKVKDGLQVRGSEAFITGATGKYELETTIIPNDATQPLQQIFTEFSIGDSSPNPPNPDPGPTPTPTPAPVFPEDSMGFAQASYGWALAVATSPTWAQECTAMARSHKTVADQVAAGILTGAAAIQGALVNANRTALDAIPGSRDRWVPFGQQYGAKVAPLYSSGQLDAPGKWALVLNECYYGLDAASKVAR